MAVSGSTSRSKTSRVAEVTRGVTPATPAFKEMRVTSNQLAFTPGRVTSQEIRSDRQVTDQVLVKFDSGGQIGFELSFGAFDDEIEAVLQGAWTNTPSITVATIDVEISDVSATTLTVVTPLGTPFKAGMLVYTTGLTTAANNGIISRVSSSSATTVVFPGATFVAEGAQIPVGAAARVIGFMGAAGDLVATITGGNAITSTVLDFTTLGLNVGQWVKIGGDLAASQWATTADNGWARISVIAATRLSFDTVPASWAADAGAAKTIQVFFGDWLINGTTQRSFSIERQQQDIAAPSYEYFVGQQIDTMSLPFDASKILVGTFTYMGQGSPSATTVRFAGATDVAASTNPVMNSSSNVGTLAEGGVLVSGPSYLMSVGLDIKNNLGAQSAIANVGPVGILDGQVEVTGKFTSYFGDLTILNKVINNTDTGIMRRVARTDNVREGYVFDVPSVKLSGTTPIAGANQSRMFDGTYAAKRHPTLAYTISVSRQWYLPLTA